MSDTQDLQALLNYAYFYLKFRPRSKKEVRDYLYKKIERRHFSRDVANQAIKNLEEQDLVNDKNFIVWFVEQRNLSKPKSKFALKSELLRFGISKDLIDDYFLNNELPEDELALKALKPRWQRYSSLPSVKRFEKAASFLARRGFSFEIIKNTIEKLEEKDN